MDDLIFQLLSPIPGGVPVDTQLNQMLRDARKPAWRKAQARTRYWEAKIEFMHAEDALARDGREVTERPRQCWKDWLAELRSSQRAQIRTPAPNAAAVEWKVRQVARAWCLRETLAFEISPEIQSSIAPDLTKDDAEALIAEDERWLAAHPVRISRRSSVD